MESRENVGMKMWFSPFFLILYIIIIFFQVRVVLCGCMTVTTLTLIWSCPWFYIETLLTSLLLVATNEFIKSYIYICVCVCVCVCTCAHTYSVRFMSLYVISINIIHSFFSLKNKKTKIKIDFKR